MRPMEQVAFLRGSQSVGAGLLLTLAFPPTGWWPAAPAAVALLTIAIWQPARRPLRRGAALGFVFGAVFFVVLLFWLHVIGPDAWLVLGVVEALYLAPLGAGIAAVRRLRFAPLWTACLWVAEEAARERLPVGGFTWGRLAFSQAASPFTRDAAVGGVPTLVGAMTHTADGKHLANLGIVWSPTTGAGTSDVKRHPVPFGEYVPLRPVLTTFIKRFALVPYDQVAGHRPGVLRLGPVTIGDVICFEVPYDAIVRDAVTHGGRVIVVQTNNADFGRTDQPAQQLAVSRLRAVEHAQPVLVAATSGISAIITSDGRVLSKSRQFSRAILVRQVRASAAITLADLLGELPEWILAAAGIGAAAAGVWLLATPDGSRRRQEV